MPELPEVEIITRGLNKKLKHKRVKGLKALDAKALYFSTLKFRQEVIGQKVKSVRRRAKMMIIELESKFIVIHLKMTGQLVYKSARGLIVGGHPITNVGQEFPNKFTRVIFLFFDKSKLYFNDVRRFGWIKLINSRAGLAEYSATLGVEPLSKKFSLEKFKDILGHKQKTTIKQAIMDQKYLVGLGNIYADEVLFASGIKPVRKVNTLSGDEIKKLWKVIPRVLKFAIKHRGTSFSSYVDAKGEAGNFIKYLKVYGRDGQKCKKCKNIIKKMKLAGRGTHWCNRCQK